MSERTVIVSDIHCGAIPAENERAFLSFLAEVPELGDELIINGDLFHFWFEYGEVIPRGHTALFARLRALVDAGVPVSFIGGNHDAWGGSFLRDEIGLEVLEGPLTRTVGDRRAYIAHGDGLVEGRAYMLLRTLSRSQLNKQIYRWIHPDLAIPLTRQFARIRESAAPRPGAFAASMASRAHKALARHADIDLVVFGHIHTPELSMFAPGKFYLNTGNWVCNMSFAVVTPDEIRLECYPVRSRR